MAVTFVQVNAKRPINRPDTALTCHRIWLIRNHDNYLATQIAQNGQSICVRLIHQPGYNEITWVYVQQARSDKSA